MEEEKKEEERVVTPWDLFRGTLETSFVSCSSRPCCDYNWMSWSLIGGFHGKAELLVQW